MEHSSPLAAMQPPSLPIGHWDCRNERQNQFPIGQCGFRFNFGPSNFDFRDLNPNQAPTDYFNLKPVRGSSPTASLAADLSQNFHIDRSPQLPTPRRALFSSNLFGTLTGRAGATTPPLPSSSPGPMDISPLPHKAPYQVTTQVQLQSPTPEATPNHAVNILCAETVQQQPSVEATAIVTAITALTIEDQRSFNHFGNGSSQPTSNLGSLDECFTASPPQDRRPNSANSPLASLMGPPKLRQPFNNLHAHSRSSASPIVGHARKPSSNGQRPRKQFRRSLSMFEHPGDVMKEQQSKCSPAEGLSSIMDTDDNTQVELNLPHFIADEESVPRITKATMVDVLDGKYQAPYDHSLIVDCRFEYEYEGGHIAGAINVNSKEELASKLFEPVFSSRTLLIFHCEYSAHRAPLM
ncbi:MAG: hypothetical protein Q9210_002696 [Variospora velana]